MKQTIFTLFAFFLLSISDISLLAQQRIIYPEQRNAAPANTELRTGLETNVGTFTTPSSTPIPQASSIRTRTEAEVIIGTTRYDLQTNSSICNRFSQQADGSIFATWTQGFLETAYNDRGTGYNSYTSNGGWGSVPTARLESSARTGWPNHVLTADGTEFIVNHVFDSGSYRLHYLKRAAGETTWTEGDLPTNTPFGSLWPRAVAGGADGNSIHIISVTTSIALGGIPYEGVDLHIIYHRSTDAGATWDIVDGIIPGLDSTLMVELARSDAYAIDTKDDIVAVGLFGLNNDVKVFKSMDNGDNWTNWRINDFPLDKYAFDTGYSINDLPPYDPNTTPNPGDIYTSDASGAVLVDNNGMVHAWYGEMFITDSLAGDGWFFYPCTSGIAYWNETHGEDSVRTITSVLDLNGNGILDIDCQAFNFGRYGLAGLNSYPSAAVDANNNIYLSYQMVMEGDEYISVLDPQHYTHVWLMASMDGGETWNAPYDIVNTDVLSDPEAVFFTEAVFGHLAKRVDENVHLIYQADFRPGLSTIGDTDPTEDNFINYVAVSVEELGVAVSTEEPLSDKSIQLSIMPNPAHESVRILYDLPANEAATVTVLDIVGKQVLVANNVTGFKGLNSAVINLGDLNSGIYFLQLKAGQNTITQKLIIQ
ncbi:MAG: T9SS type A sorting domain-containing protein [Saprospiraceae bacterium]